ncbi:winged helix-turn-helix domain-containing protein [Gorillibacterium timonense]|uniref:winged helix-turn-helix domain-containing protein n=1 Tax=Gorillibacterium timonense TaxID=1689269 RepID=UPI00071D0AD0|nr:crosslink repair DNA glycosylase YcaQ family protein [Gorillibacterium timonense]
MSAISFSKEQAGRFLLLKHGLLGEYRFMGKEGVCRFVRQAGCIQYDPIDVCGKNAELVLQARVPGFTKGMLEELLYEDRKLIDYFDKNMAIIQAEDWKYFSRTREAYGKNGRSRDNVDRVKEQVKQRIRDKGYACSKDIDLKETVDWYWNSTSLARAALESFYFRGELIVHHKKGTMKYYGLAEDYLESSLLTAPDPNESEDDYLKWQAERRIGSVGLLWNKASDAWLGISGFGSEARNRIFSLLEAEGRITECSVEGMVERFYIRKEDKALADRVRSETSLFGRLEFLAPLDNLLWDRKLIKAIFGFDYKWEIYTPLAQRKFGYYVLPVLDGTRFLGRIEMTVDKKKKELTVQHLWLEPEMELTDAVQRRLQERLTRFAEFHQCRTIHSLL